MQNVGQTIKLFISQKGSSLRLKQTDIQVDNKGVLGDKFYNKNRERSVLLTSIESYDLVNRHNIILPYGALGENILMDFNPYALEVGSWLSIGSAILEISQPCTICNHLSVFDKRLPKLLQNDRGIFAKVIHSGTITEGDAVRLNTI